MSTIKVMKVVNEEIRVQAIEVITKVYQLEKNWISMPESEISNDIGSSQEYSWFLAFVNNEPAGVIRLTYDPSLDFPAELGVTLNQGIDLDKMARECRMVEIGRFMILPQYRKNIRVALRLMRASIKEVVERGYSHFLTDVFETDPHSPLHFHTKVLGFERIGSHIRGELHCSSTRIILTLDILKSYQRLKVGKNKIYQEVTEGIRELLDEKLAKRLNSTVNPL
ncbi:MAG TPA: GNAT family N-acetyltransferase [Firmicutes bacterium]|jgi:hypothetical protein|nr:GNAT family N-acetyltransferase [Bacillota bacterium]